jgi:DNA-binding PadR family transcriptional regulator
MDVRTLCLGILTLGDASGYEIKKQFEEGPLAYFYQIGYGAIYPALKSLNRDGMVNCEEVMQHGRPNKKIYSITAKGVESFHKNLPRIPACDKLRSEAIVMFFFARFLEEEHLNEVFEGYLEENRKAVENIKSIDLSGISPECQFTNGLGLTVYEAIIHYMVDNRHLLFSSNIHSYGLDSPSSDGQL